MTLPEQAGATCEEGGKRIQQEIDRLSNAIVHLESSNQQLAEALKTDPDPCYEEAIQVLHFDARPRPAQVCHDSSKESLYTHSAACQFPNNIGSSQCQ